jgi:hypothetical protein
MIKTMTANIDGQVITFSSSDGVNWYVTSVSPNQEGVYPITLSITTDKGGSYTYTTDDAAFGKYLELYVTNHNSNLIKYLPPFLQEVKEFKALFDPIDKEIDILHPVIESVFAETIIMYCSEARIKEWEKALNVVPLGTIDERRFFIKALLRGNGKLNEAKIKSIVDAFTGGDAIVELKDSTIIVKVLPPNNGEIFRFPDVERALKPLIPAHLDLSVVRFYSTWDDIKNNFAGWNSVAQSEDWNAVKNWIAP